MTKQTEAERLAKALEGDHPAVPGARTKNEAAAELRRLVSFNQQLMDEVARLNKALAEQPAQQEPDDERIAALRTLDYCHGLKAGWNFCVANDDAGFERAMTSTSEAVRILKKQPAQQEPVPTIYVYRQPDGSTQVMAPDINNPGLVIDMLEEGIRAMSEGRPIIRN